MNATVIAVLDSVFNPDDLFAKDARAFHAAGIRRQAIAELARFEIRAASDALDWRPRDLLRIPNIGRQTIEKIAALIELA